MRFFRDANLDLSLVRGRRVAIIGYGNQGRAQALNLRDSGVDVILALPPASARRPQAAAEGFEVLGAGEAAARADIVVLLAPDESQAAIYEADIAPALRPGGALLFAHGLNIRFGLIRPRPDLDVLLVAPKGPGTALRDEYEKGSGLVSLFAVAQDASGEAESLALSYAGAIGSGRRAIIRTSFAEESEADIFNEAAVVWGAIPELLEAGFETLVEAGFSPEIAYFECVSELKLIADLIYERGIAGMREAISNTAEFAALYGGARIVDPRVRDEMRRLLAEVRSGAIVEALVSDSMAGYPRLTESRRAAREKAIEQVRLRLRQV